MKEFTLPINAELCIGPFLTIRLAQVRDGKAVLIVKQEGPENPALDDAYDYAPDVKPAMFSRGLGKYLANRVAVRGA
jgi:hypothetical protein